MSTEPLPVYLKDNFITKTECQTLIDLFDKHHASVGTVFDDRKILHIPIACVELSNNDTKNDADYLKFFSKKIDININSIDPQAYTNYSHITRREKGNYQPSHLDFDYHTLTSIIYLNDNFTGGETKVADEIIQPKAGTIITFQGNKIQHEVLPVVEGIRYNVLVWYKCY